MKSPSIHAPVLSGKCAGRQGLVNVQGLQGLVNPIRQLQMTGRVTGLACSILQALQVQGSVIDATAGAATEASAHLQVACAQWGLDALPSFIPLCVDFATDLSSVWQHMRMTLMKCSAAEPTLLVEHLIVTSQARQLKYGHTLETAFMMAAPPP
jgi:hypothetical protein